ncbi:hypothetical protein ASH00_01210 [Arthrobacter sp. Soil782]|uniref:hypothetical protein n=1 Tax=Arthrobacter sp. Soil782 TaxID=1736410 RepID=UPI0006F3E8B7|nr:hypothetical protein [Arthrobacter sp. Soil782]KRF08376.1 hypothetical protein ASH00_01210 [Arthrobacter sp. Soil782]
MTETVSKPDQADSPYPDAIGFGFAEVAALLNLAPGAAATASAAALRVSDEIGDTRMVAAGGSSLVARGLAFADSDGVLSVGGPVAAVTRALTTARRRIEISLVAPDYSDSVVSIESAEYEILMQPRSHLTWFAMAKRPDITSAEANLFIVQSHCAEHPDGGALVKNRETPEAGELLIKVEEGAWTVGRRLPGADSVESKRGLSDSDVLAQLRALRQD